MNRLKLYLLALTALIVCSAKADEGMWLLQLMQQQHSIDMMKKQGLKLEAQDLYNPHGVSLKDAVGIFGGGCTGEIISPEGLILTNHHCGYASIQQHSSVEHDYLTDGFWATSREMELPTPGLKFTFIERIEDITDIVNAKIAAKEITETESFSGAFLQKLAEELYAKSDLKDKKGIVPQALPFYAGNKFYMFYKKVYPDVRMVAAPPSSIQRRAGRIQYKQYSLENKKTFAYFYQGLERRRLCHDYGISRKYKPLSDRIGSKRTHGIGKRPAYPYPRCPSGCIEGSDECK